MYLESQVKRFFQELRKRGAEGFGQSHVSGGRMTGGVLERSQAIVSEISKRVVWQGTRERDTGARPGFILADGNATSRGTKIEKQVCV